MPQRGICITQFVAHQVLTLPLLLISLEYALKEAEELGDPVIPKVCRLFQRFFFLVLIVLRDSDGVVRVVSFIVEIERRKGVG